VLSALNLPNTLSMYKVLYSAISGGCISYIEPNQRQKWQHSIAKYSFPHSNVEFQFTERLLWQQWPSLYIQSVPMLRLRGRKLGTYLLCSPEVPGIGGLRMLSNNILPLDNGGGSSCSPADIVEVKVARDFTWALNRSQV